MNDELVERNENDEYNEIKDELAKLRDLQNSLVVRMAELREEASKYASCDKCGNHYLIGKINLKNTKCVGICGENVDRLMLVNRCPYCGYCDSDDESDWFVVSKDEYYEHSTK